MSAMTYQRPSTIAAPARPRRLPRTAVDPRALVSATPSRAADRRPAGAGAGHPADREARRETSALLAPRAPRRTLERPAPPLPTTASPGAPARLTRRGRVVVVLVLAAIALVLFSLGRASSSSATPQGRAASPRPTTVVQPGDTLWSIARRIAPGADPRVTVDRLADLNDLGGRPIQAGQTLTLPYAGS